MVLIHNPNKIARFIGIYKNRFSSKNSVLSKIELSYSYKSKETPVRINKTDPMSIIRATDRISLKMIRKYVCLFVAALTLFSSSFLHVGSAGATVTVPLAGRILDTSSTPMAGWTITMSTSDNSASATLTTDSSGNFSGYVPGESPSGQPNNVYLRPNVSFPTQPSSTFHWDPSDSVLNMTVPKVVNFTAHFSSNGTAIQGSYVDSYSCPGSAGSWANTNSFNVVSGQQITLVQQYNSGSNTDASGNTTISGWPKSSLVLCGYAPLHGVNTAAIVTTNLTSTTSVVNFDVIDTSKPLAGRILDTSSTPMAGWTITMSTSDNSASATLTTDSSGNFSGYVPGESPSGQPNNVYLRPNVSFPTQPSSTFHWDPSVATLNMTVPAILNQKIHVTNNGVPIGGVQIESYCTTSWMNSDSFNVVPGQQITMAQQYNSGESTDLNGDVIVQGFPITGARVCADMSGAGVSFSKPSTINFYSNTQVVTIASNFDIPLLPMGTRLIDLQAPTAVIANTGVATTATATISSTSAVLTAPANSLPTGTTLNLFPLTGSYPSSAVLPQGATYISGFAVNWSTPSGQSPNSSAPITVVLTDSSIKVGDTVYMIANGELKIVGTATVAGTMSITFDEDPIFLLSSPAAAVVTPGEVLNSQVASIPPGATTATFSGATVANAAISFSSSGSTATATVVPVTNPTPSALTPFTSTGGFAIVDIQVSGITGPVTVCLDGSASDHLFHYTGGVWLDITTTHASGQVCGVTSTFSPFGAGVPQAIAPVILTSKPTAPSNVTASLSNGTAAVSFTPGSSGNLPTYNQIDMYINGQLAGNVCNVTGATSCPITNLGPDATFTFTVTAVNSKGSAASGVSNAVSYASPTTLPPTTTTTTTTVPPTKLTITCVKGKVTKKVTAVSPVCPAGYKKK